MENEPWMLRALALESQQDYLKKEIEILSRSNFDKVKEFHRKFNRVPDPSVPTIPETSNILLRLRIMSEEVKEAFSELGCDVDIRYSHDPERRVSLVKVAKELADVLVVVYGTAAACGINIDEVFDAVHESNMTKVDGDGKPVYREDGKIMKTEHYVEPDIKKVLTKN